MFDSCGLFFAVTCVENFFENPIANLQIQLIKRIPKFRIFLSYLVGTLNQSGKLSREQNDLFWIERSDGIVVRQEFLHGNVAE